MIVIINVVLLVLLMVLFLTVKKNDSRIAEAEARLKEEINLARRELSLNNNDVADKLLRQVMVLGEGNEKRMESLRQTVDERLQQLSEKNNARLEEMRQTVDQKLGEMRDNNDKQLENMRQTVDEKLHNSLEKRLGESFKLVSERLEQVHQGLGEMQVLASGVGDLKKVLSNVKVRGTWGEVQLSNLLEQMLSPGQYEANVATNPTAPNNRVEFALKLPGKGDNNFVYLPIDAKFPLEDYQLLVDAQEKGDAMAAREAGAALERRLKACAKDVRDKYISPPYTTDFAIIFLPMEGLFSELLCHPGLQEYLQETYRVVLAGPTTFAALLNSLQMGFRTLAIEKQAGEVWNLLGAVKTGFGVFGELLSKTQKKLQEASNSIDKAAQKTRGIEQKLRKVSQLPQAEAEEILRLDIGGDDDEITEEEEVE